MTLELKKPLVFFDLETTGIEISESRIIEISLAKQHPDGYMESKTRRFNPGVPIPLEATAVHGISDADVADEMPFREFAGTLAEFLTGCDLAGYNLIRFDLPLLEKEFERAQVAFSIQGRNVLDVMRIFHLMEPRDLKAACRFYLGHEHARAHSAEADVTATADILSAMMKRYSDLPRGIDGLCDTLRAPGTMDICGNFIIRNGKPTFSFGKYKGKSLDWVVANDPNYLRWLLNQNYLSDTKAIIEQHLHS